MLTCDSLQEQDALQPALLAHLLGRLVPCEQVEGAPHQLHRVESDLLMRLHPDMNIYCCLLQLPVHLNIQVTAAADWPTSVKLDRLVCLTRQCVW